MKTAGDKRSFTQNLEPDDASMPLLEQRTPNVPRWNPPQGEGAPQVSGLGEASDRLKLGPPGSRRADCVPLLIWGLIPVLTSPTSCCPPQTQDQVTQWGQSEVFNILCPLLKCHKKIVEQS